MPQQVRTSYKVPYYAQVASPEMAGAIFREEISAVADPNWAITGAESPDEYAYWVMRACGMVCLKMAVEALGGPVRPLMAWIREGLARGAYKIRKYVTGEREEIGWVHDGLIAMMREQGLSADRGTGTVSDIQAALREDKLVIASVTYELGSLLPITRNSGHLVLVHGYQSDETGCTGLILNNPSGRSIEFQQDAVIPIERFRQGFSGRIIRVWKE